MTPHQMKTFERNSNVVLLTILYTVILSPESVEEILKCRHSSKIHRQCLPKILVLIVAVDADVD